MGREIRRVPPNWEHPADRTGYKPLCDQTIENAFQEWHKELHEWLDGTHSYIKYYEKNTYETYCDYAGTSPDPSSYRPYTDQEATWYQAYENVSDGTPVSPPFETKEELIEYLVKNGDYFAQECGDPPPSREAVEKFVQNGYVPSMAFYGGEIKTGIRVNEIKEQPAQAD